MAKMEKHEGLKRCNYKFIQYWVTVARQAFMACAEGAISALKFCDDPAMCFAIFVTVSIQVFLGRPRLRGPVGTTSNVPGMKTLHRTGSP